MKLSIYPKVFYRVPQFPLNAELTEAWEELKQSILIASAAFYENIKMVEAGDLESLPAGIYHTVWKYFNRGKYRATPYGSFAGFGMGAFGKDRDIPFITVNDEQQLKTFIDWPYKEELEYTMDDLIRLDFLLFTNTSYYLRQGYIRYISRFDGVFQLSDVEVNDFMLKVLELCKKPVRFSRLVKLLGITGPELELLEELIVLQLLFTSRDANIIGQEYYTRIGEAVDAAKPQYILTERNYAAGALDPGLAKALPELASLMHRLIPAQKNKALENFTARFKQKFESSEVPLMLALDPELGIGYGDLEEAAGKDELVAFFSTGQQPEEVAGKDNKLKKFVLDAMLRGSAADRKVVQLEQFAMELPDPETIVPNSFSALCGLTGDGLCLFSFGGATATSLLGRFTLGNAEVLEYCREMALLDQQANPEVLFFDIGYMAEAKVDNVNRRQQIYEQQLSILNYDTSENPLVINDLCLTLKGNELILFSKRLNKRLVPRLASAYNYTRSDLPLFRLLCDLQNQNLQTNFSFSLQDSFPAQPFYPRLQFKNIVISPAKWEVTYEGLKAFSGGKAEISSLKSYLQHLGTEGQLIVRTADMTLCFDLEDQVDVAALLTILSKQKNVYLEEAFVPVNSPLKDTQGRNYQAQLLISLTHGQQIYNGYHSNLDIAEENTGVQQVIPPGGEWLYFEIYSHFFRADFLLQEHLADLLKIYKEYIKSWFFIRYNENGDHLRFRVLLHRRQDAQVLIAVLSDQLKAEMESGVVSDLQIKTYKRELQRYSAAGMEAVEAHFCVDSTYVLALFEQELSVMDKYLLCIGTIFKVMKAGLFDPVVFGSLVERICGSFAKEHNLEVQGFKKLNNEYKTFKALQSVELNGTLLVELENFGSSFIRTLAGCGEEKRGQLFGDLMHMHVNRLFNSHQRTHEMIMYYFLSKELQYKMAIKKTLQVVE